MRKKGSIRYVREQLQQYGAHTLSSVELLTLVLCTGAGSSSMRTRMQTLFLDHGGLQELLRADFGEIVLHELLNLGLRHGSDELADNFAAGKQQQSGNGTNPVIRRRLLAARDWGWRVRSMRLREHSRRSRYASRALAC